MSYQLKSLTLYSFMRAGSTVKGEQVSATMAMATVVHTRFCRSWTFRLFSSVTSTSCMPSRPHQHGLTRISGEAHCTGCSSPTPPLQYR